MMEGAINTSLPPKFTIEAETENALQKYTPGSIDRIAAFVHHGNAHNYVSTRVANLVFNPIGGKDMKYTITAITMMISLSLTTPVTMAAKHGGMMNMQDRMQEMQDTMEQIRDTKDEAMRHEMMKKHMEQMRGSMMQMHEMMGGRGNMMEKMGGSMGMMDDSKQGGGMMGDKKGMRGDGMKSESDSPMSSNLMSQKMLHMGRRMDMMQMMMDQMMEHQQQHEKMHDQ